MADWQGIEQFEYRWQPAVDMSLIAGSLQPESIQPWSDRIALWVRHRAAEAPTESVRYEIFGGGMAALAWRQRNAKAIKFEDGTEGRPEVSRVLMGPVHLLTPEVAVTVCRAGLPATIGPRPGTCPVGSLLPSVEPAELTGLARDMADELDRLAVDEPGLDRVIAAALTDRDLALSVQLPDRVIERLPQEGSQGPLLWGLRRAVWPLLGRDAGERGWSFSTWEPPQGDVGTGALADIVFRAQQPVLPGMTMRQEILARPHEPTEPPATIRYQDFARLLVDAYRYLGGGKLAQHLDAVGGEFPSVEERIEAVQASLYAVVPAEAMSTPSRRYLPPAPPEYQEAPPSGEVARAPDTVPPGDVSWPEDVAQYDWAVTPAPGGPAAPYPQPQPQPPQPQPQPQQQPQQPPTAPRSSAPPPTWAPRPPAPPLAATNRAREDAPPLPEPASPLPTPPRPEPAAEAPSYTLSSLLDQLYAGQEDQGFESALRLLHTADFPDRMADRATARQRIPERDWYLPVLLQYDNVHFEDTLEAIFRLAVIPDLGRPEVIEELARWAGERAAPPPVIKALNAAAQNSTGAPELIRQALEPPLGRRWLAEHGIYTGPSEFAAAPAAPRFRGTHAATPPRSRLGLLYGRLRSDPVALLELFCAILIALLVLSLVH